MEQKLGENVYVENVFRSERITAVTVYWNGISITTGSCGVDTGPYNDAMFVLNVGTVLGQRASLLNSVYESDQNDPTTSVALTGCDFTTGTTSADETNQLGNLIVGDHKRYLWLRTELQNAYDGSTAGTETATIDFAAAIALGGANAKPVSNTLVFDV